MNFESHSQAGQDLFVYRTLVEPEGLLSGTMLDVGAGHHKEISNTWALEQLGWRGYLIEQDAYAADMLRKNRQALTMEAPAEKIDWRAFPNKRFDYLSLDVDYISHGVLLEMLIAGLSFRVATIEHNAYNYPDGSGPAWASRALMAAKGYDLVCEDVKHGGCIFEDWYCDQTVPQAARDRFRCIGMEGRAIVGLDLP